MAFGRTAKDSLLSSFMEVASGQSKQIDSLNTTIQDTVMWDPCTCPRPSSCSTPSRLPSAMMVRSRKKDAAGTASPPPLSLSNSYAPLSEVAPIHPADAPVVPTRPNLDPDSVPADTAATPPLVPSSSQSVCRSTVKPNQQTSSSGLLRSLPSSTTQVILHVGTNDLLIESLS